MIFNGLGAPRPWMLEKYTKINTFWAWGTGYKKYKKTIDF